MSNIKENTNSKGTPYAKACFFCQHCSSAEHIDHYCEIRSKEVSPLDDCSSFLLDSYYTHKENAYDCSRTLH